MAIATETITSSTPAASSTAVLIGGSLESSATPSASSLDAHHTATGPTATRATSAWARLLAPDGALRAASPAGTTTSHASLASIAPASIMASPHRPTSPATTSPGPFVAWHPHSDPATSTPTVLPSSRVSSASKPESAAGQQQQQQQQQQQHDAGNDDPRLAAAASAAVNARSRFRQWRSRTADRMSNLRLGGGTLDRDKEPSARKESKKDPFAFFPMLGSALQVPFATLAVSPMPPVVLEAFHIRVSFDVDESLYRAVKSESFLIQCQYGSRRWSVRRSVADFLAMHASLFRHFYLNLLKRKLPPLPSTFSWALDHMQLQRRGNAVDALNAQFAYEFQEYLVALLKALNMLPELGELCEFLRFSSVSFLPSFPHKPLELPMVLRTSRPWKYFRCLTHTKKRDRWLAVGPSWLTLLASFADPHPHDVILMSTQFEFASHVSRNPVGIKRYAIRIANNAAAKTTVDIRLDDEDEHDELLRVLSDATAKCAYVRAHPHGSFAPARKGCQVEFFVDGQEYFERVADAIMAAKKTVYILDWWLTPELYLKRPITAENERWRLDRLLQEKAKEGVQIHILVYKEISAALANCSYHTKFYLVSLHPNIHVQRHPDVVSGQLFWAHHEKAVIIDDTTVFMGGLDLCLGRWDTHAHPLIDLAPPDSGAQIFPGQDYSNPRVTDFAAVDRDWANDTIDRATTPRMPWHDVACVLHGPAAGDVARHFVQRWNFVKGYKAEQRSDISLLLPSHVPPETAVESGGGVEAAHTEVEDGEEPLVVEEMHPTRNTATTGAVEGGEHTVQLTRSLGLWSCGIPTEHSILNAYLQAIDEAKYFIYIENQFFVTSSTEAGGARNKIGQALYRRILRAHENQQPFRVIVMMPLLPAFPGGIDSAAASTLRMVMNFQFESIDRGPNSLIAKLDAAGVPHGDYISFYGLRTYDWLPDPSPTTGAGAPAAGTTPGTRVPVGTEIPDGAPEPAAASTAQAGEIPVPASSASGSPKSLPSQVQGKDTASAPASGNGSYVTEMVYIHTKLMIVDDVHVMLGSANINDRSMLGERDSELALAVTGARNCRIRMGDEEITVDKRIHGLRMALMKEHVGSLHHDADDAVLANVLAPEFMTKWAGTAKTNTTVYRDLFHALPDDTVETWAQYRSFTSTVPSKSMSKAEVEARIGDVKGHVVEFPTRFLRQEALGANLFSAENLLVPPEIFA
ncbi:Phospholipase [Allomyces arbusculus]|nr:Phospholipase [Allomyces arbusculus]